MIEEKFTTEYSLAMLLDLATAFLYFTPSTFRSVFSSLSYLSISLFKSSSKDGLTDFFIELPNLSCNDSRVQRILIFHYMNNSI